MSGSPLAKLCLGLSVITTIIYAIAFASPYWIQKDFSLNVPGYILGLPARFNNTMTRVTVSSNMGLLTSCDDINAWIVPGFPPRNSMDCSADGADDWQYAAAAFGIAGLVVGVFSIGLSTAVVFLDRRPYYNKLRLVTVVCYFFTSVSVMIPLILYGTQKEFQVKPPLPNREEYDLFWAFWVALATDILYAILGTLHLLQLLTTPSSEESQKDASASYRMDYKVPAS